MSKWKRCRGRLNMITTIASGFDQQVSLSHSPSQDLIQKTWTRSDGFTPVMGDHPPSLHRHVCDSHCSVRMSANTRQVVKVRPHRELVRNGAYLDGIPHQREPCLDELASRLLLLHQQRRVSRLLPRENNTHANKNCMIHAALLTFLAVFVDLDLQPSVFKSSSYRAAMILSVKRPESYD